MNILFVADGRSPTTLNWLQYWVEANHCVHLISTYPCDPFIGLASFHVLPVAFGRMAGSQVNIAGAAHKPRLGGQLRERFRLLRYYLGPASLVLYQAQYRSLVKKIQPDLVHALRIPFEGMLAKSTPPGIPLVLSTWGNDLTLHAHGSSLMKILTKLALIRADGLISDTRRDVRLSYDLGFRTKMPTLVVPGSGGIRAEAIEAVSKSEKLPEELLSGAIIVNSRGQRPGSLRQDVFFQAIPLVVAQVPQAIFVCPSLQYDIESEKWVESLGIRSSTRLWPRLSQTQLWALFKRSQVFVSPSIHDGTPNSMLEAMACGCFPVVGGTESMREWVDTGVNGLIVDATNARSLANAIIQAIKEPILRIEAAKLNAKLITERAAYGPNMARVEEFYKTVSFEK